MLLDASLVGRVIQDYRESKGLSQEVVSGLADIGRTHLSAIERGTRKPTLETFFRISEALLDFLVGGFFIRTESVPALYIRQSIV